MIRITLGEMLRRFRMEKGLEAKQVCEGLCSTAMMIFKEELAYYEWRNQVRETIAYGEWEKLENIL